MSLVRNDLKIRLKHRLSSFKNWLISCDNQDIYRSDFARDNPLVHAAPSLVSYTVYEEESVLALMELVVPQSPQDRIFVRQRLGRGDKAVIGFIDDQPVFYGWLMFSEIEVTYGVFLPLGPHIAFAYNLYTRSSHRRMGAVSGFYDFVLRYLREQGFHTLYVGIDSDNRPSVKAHEKNGFRKDGYFHTLKLMGFCFTLAGFPGAKRFFMNGPQ